MLCWYMASHTANSTGSWLATVNDMPLAEEGMTASQPRAAAVNKGQRHCLDCDLGHHSPKAHLTTQAAPERSQAADGQRRWTC